MNVETQTKTSVELSIPFLRSRRNSKWHGHGDDVLPAPVAEMDFAGGGADPRGDGTPRVREQEFGYPQRDGGRADMALANAFVRRMQSRFGWHTDAADTLPIADLVQGPFASVMAFSDPGDSVILQMPSYPPFRTAIDETGRVLQEDRLRDDGTHFVMDLDALEAATWSARARVAVLPSAEPDRTRVQPSRSGSGRAVRHAARPHHRVRRDPCGPDPSRS